MVRHLHDRVRGIIGTQDNLQKEVGLLARVHKPPTQEATDASSGDERKEKQKGRLLVIQWNLTIMDTIGNQNFVHYSEVSLTQGFPVYFQ